MNQELENYIKRARAQGIGDEQIKQQLLAAGWEETDVNATLNPTFTPPMPLSDNNIPKPPAMNMSQSTGMAILAYLGILIIIPFLSSAKNELFVKFHLKQGLVLILLGVAYWVLTIFLSMFHLWFLGVLIYPVIGIGFLVLVIIGIMNAVSGQMKELPIVGHFGNKFNF